MNRDFYGKLIFEVSHKGRKGYCLPKTGIEGSLGSVPSNLLRSEMPSLPEVDELTVVRHYTNMSNNNFGVDTGFYPLGSCTMKYNPKINEEIASDKSIANLHPLQPSDTVQGALELYHTLERALSEIGGMSEFTLNPGTNPASAAVAGLTILEVKSRPDGTVDVDDLRPLLDDTVAAVMMTNPNTLGIFERNIPEIASLVHEAGALLYYDGANLNPLVGVARPGDMGFDVMHINLHKTFSTPHGGGGPGAGPVGVRKGLEHLLPNPRVVLKADGKYDIEYSGQSLGQVTGTLGNFTVCVKALSYILSLGRNGLKWVGPLATLNANYIKESLKDKYLLPIEGVCKHEFVYDGLKDKSTGVTTLNVAKRLLDFGFHAPTIYFPLLFHESLMIEPTETESIETLDEFIAVMRRIADEAVENPEMVKSAPHNTPISHPDDTEAALHPMVTYSDLTIQEN